MFTGLVQAMGRIVRLSQTGEGEGVLRVAVEPWDEPWRRGESVAVQGACLTLRAIQGFELEFDILKETMDRTTLGRLATGSFVNMERALRLSDRLGGHMVTGHIDGTAAILQVEQLGRDIIVTVEPPEGLMRYCALKGSITLDGVSLTIARRSQSVLSVCLIPTTRSETVAAHYRVNEIVNVEVDIVARYIESLAGRVGWGGGSPSTVTEAALIRAGFIS